jgi:5-deoxy-D-glucuronate isomerase
VAEPLSPAAQAVLDAVIAVCPAPADEIAAVALRAAADQVEHKLRGFSRETCQEIRAIAAELEGSDG